MSKLYTGCFSIKHSVKSLETTAVITEEHAQKVFKYDTER